MEATKGIDQNSIKGGTKDCLLFDIWFVSKKAAEAAIEMGDKFISMVKTNYKGFCKERIEKLTKDCPGVSYLVLRSETMVPRYRPLIAIRYKYNARKVISCIVTDNSGRKNTGIPYLSKYPDQFTNVAIRPVARPLVMSNVFLMLIRLTPTTNQDNIIWHCRSGGLLHVVGCGYVRQLLWA